MDDRKARLEDAVRNGLRTEGGSLIGGLYVEEYVQGMNDFKAGNSPPAVTTASYDLGRQKAADDAEFAQDLLRDLQDSARRSQEAILALLADKPEALAEHKAAIVERESGRTDARMQWYSLSAAMQSVVMLIFSGGGSIRRKSDKTFTVGETTDLVKAVSVLALIRRSHLVWSDEAQTTATLTKKGRLMASLVADGKMFRV